MTNGPGPAPYIQHQLAAHPAQDQLRVSNPRQLLIPTSSFLPLRARPLPGSPLDAHQSPCVLEDNDRFSKEGKRCAIRGADPGTTAMFPLISRVRAANKATELSHMSPGHSPST